ncbi:natural cytotoxicity triggering receptor 1-like isoform X4 [Trichosurus vulpecula]|uniref:natural cytotoxicity triggering receptor 1-like isoform X4 n=1 Tax=Trichosurus vulpecula TaxID=9337 RepID=UPI00186B44EC|nr:natural cytotoxicity triggering receptor 1-like isoform X4 [Trichosurus vulpecula]
MAPKVTSLLFLGLCLNQKITSPEGTLPRPYIRAVSSSVVPKRAEVSFYCQGPQGRKTFQLWKEKQLMLQINTSKEEVRFHRAIKSTSATENYSCRYFQDSHWSEFSTPLQLVVTGFFSPPKLQVQPGTVVAVGETVTFVCQVSGRSNLKKLTFFLLKAGVAGPVQQQNLEVKMANFTLPSVKAEDAGNYSCVCLVLEGKKRASDPSEVLRLEVTGKKTAHPQRQESRILLIVTVSCVSVFLLLLSLLVLFCHRHCHTQHSPQTAQAALRLSASPPSLPRRECMKTYPRGDGYRHGALNLKTPRE